MNLMIYEPYKADSDKASLFTTSHNGLYLYTLLENKRFIALHMHHVTVANHLAFKKAFLICTPKHLGAPVPEPGSNMYRGLGVKSGNLILLWI